MRVEDLSVRVGRLVLLIAGAAVPALEPGLDQWVVRMRVHSIVSLVMTMVGVLVVVLRRYPMRSSLLVIPVMVMCVNTLG